MSMFKTELCNRSTVSELWYQISSQSIIMTEVIFQPEVDKTK